MTSRVGKIWTSIFSATFSYFRNLILPTFVFSTLVAEEVKIKKDEFSTRQLFETFQMKIFSK